VGATTNPLQKIHAEEGTPAAVAVTIDIEAPKWWRALMWRNKFLSGESTPPKHLWVASAAESFPSLITRSHDRLWRYKLLRKAPSVSSGWWRNCTICLFPYFVVYDVYVHLFLCTSVGLFLFLSVFMLTTSSPPALHFNTCFSRVCFRSHFPRSHFTITSTSVVSVCLCCLLLFIFSLSTSLKTDFIFHETFTCFHGT